MATYSAVDLHSRNACIGLHANAFVEHEGKVTPTTGTSGDIYRILKIPAGTRISEVVLPNVDLDSGSPAIVVKVGYTPVNSTDGPTANDSYWGSSISAFQAGTARHVSIAAPITFAYDVFLIVTVTTSATTFASGDVYALARGRFLGNP